jgi:PAS domain S-box-containing protein
MSLARTDPSSAAPRRSVARAHGLGLERGSALRRPLELAGVALGVYLLSLASLTLLGDRKTLPVWMPNALVLAVLLRVPVERWLAIAAAAVAGGVAANLTAGDSLVAAAPLVLVNAFEYGACAAALRWRNDGEFDLTRTPLLIRFVTVAGLAAPFASAVMARAVLSLLHGPHVPVDLVLWTLGDALGLMILTPTFLVLGRLGPLLRERPLTPQAMLSLACLLLASALVFGQARYPVMFLLLPSLLWVSLEMEVLGAALGMVLLGAAAILFTAQGQGPIAAMRAGTAERAIELELFLATAVATSVSMAAMKTQRRRLQSAMADALRDAQEQARRARMAEQIARVGYWRVDVATGEVTWSDHMFSIFGLPPGNTPDFEAIRTRVHPDDRARNDEGLARAMSTGEGWGGDVGRILHPDGQVRYVTGRSVCERDERGRVCAVFGTLLDITDQKLAEMALAESEARYRLLAENASDAILHTDLKGVVTYVSPAVESLVGRSPQDLLGRNWRRVIHPQDARSIGVRGSRVRRAPRVYRPKPIQYRVLRPDGEVIWVEGQPTFVFDPATGEPCGFTDVIRDITERKALEAELTRALADAEAAAAVKTEFLANMSHELRTPITAVLGFSKLLEEEPRLRRQARRYVERVSSASKALLSAVNDILDFSKLEAGQVEIKRRPESPGLLAREAAEMFAAQARAGGVDLRVEGLKTLPRTMSIDADRLRQMLFNLVGNAIKFTEQGSVRLQAGYDAANGRLSFAVVDTGPGIAPDQLKRLFQRFSQVDASTTRRHGGTGLGLAICKGLAEAMGGEIGAESVEGKGSRFWFWIPAEPVRAASPEASGRRAPALPSGCRILVADDNPANRDLARCLLEPLGAQVQEADGGAKAVECAALAPFDVILMDVRMPGLDGPAAMRKIRAGRGPNRRTPILAFSADVGSVGEGDFVARGFDGQVGKPLTALDLIGAILACLEPAPRKPKRARRAG